MQKQSALKLWYISQFWGHIFSPRLVLVVSLHSSSRKSTQCLKYIILIVIISLSKDFLKLFHVVLSAWDGDCNTRSVPIFYGGDNERLRESFKTDHSGSYSGNHRPQLTVWYQWWVEPIKFVYLIRIQSNSHLKDTLMGSMSGFLCGFFSGGGGDFFQSRFSFLWQKWIF